jgi:hypothetical protein
LISSSAYNINNFSPTSVNANAMARGKHTICKEAPKTKSHSIKNSFTSIWDREKKYKRATLLEYLVWFHFPIEMHPVWQLA